MAVSEDALNLVNLLDKILARVVEGFAEYGVELPDRQYWMLGTPAADCEQLVVSFDQAYIGPPGDEAAEPQRCNSPRTAAIRIQILRKMPGPKGQRAQIMPKPEELQAASRVQAIDAWVLLDLACSLDFFDSLVTGHGLGVIATVDAGEVTGDMQGPTLNLTVAIP